MSTQLARLPKTIASYLKSINNHDSGTFNALFAEHAVVDDVGREFRGLAAIKTWSDKEIFDAQVTLDVIKVAEHGSETVITTKVDGNFDRTGLPDPVIINHHLTVEGDKIVRLMCRLAS